MWEIVSRNRRRAPRHPARLASSVTVAHQEAALGHSDRPPVLLGYTKDLSDEGLALVIPTVHLSDYDLTELNRTLKIVLALPVGYVEVNASLVRYQHLHNGSTESGYLVGLRIKEMSSTDRNLYQEYLHTLH